VLGELAGEDQSHRGLDLAGGHRGLLVVARQLGRLRRDLLEDVVDEGVHDGHALGGDAGVGVHLLEHLVDVDLVGLGLGLALGLAALGDRNAGSRDGSKRRLVSYIFKTCKRGLGQDASSGRRVGKGAARRQALPSSWRASWTRP